MGGGRVGGGSEVREKCTGPSGRYTLGLHNFLNFFFKEETLFLFILYWGRGK